MSQTDEQQQSVTNANNQLNPSLLPTSSNVCCHCHQSIITENLTYAQTKLTNVNAFKQVPLINQV